MSFLFGAGIAHQGGGRGSAMFGVQGQVSGLFRTLIQVSARDPVYHIPFCLFQQCFKK